MINFEIDAVKETEKKLMKRKQIIQCAEFVSSVVWIVCFFISIMNSSAAVGAAALIFLLIYGVLWYYSTFVAAVEGSRSYSALQAQRIFLKEICSDAALYNISQLVPKQNNFTDRAYVSFYLADTYAFRGQFDDAFRTMFSLDVTFFRQHPTTALVYYNELINFYDMIDDKESIIGVYNDAKYYIDMCAEKCYETYHFSRGIWVTYQAALGNYSYALDHFRNDVEQKRKVVNTGKMSNNRAYLAFYGTSLMSYANALYHTKQYAEARRICEEAMPYLPPLPYPYKKAQELRQKIEEESRVGNNS